MATSCGLQRRLGIVALLLMGGALAATASDSPDSAQNWAQVTGKPVCGEERQKGGRRFLPEEIALPVPKERAIFRAHDKPGGMVRDLVFSKDGRRLATFGGNFEVKVWDLGNQKCLQTITIPRAGPAAYCYYHGAFLPTGELLLAMQRQPQETGWEVWKYDVEAGKKERVYAVVRNEVANELWPEKNILVVMENASYTESLGPLRFIDLAGKEKDLVFRSDDPFRVLTYSRDRTLAVLAIGKEGRVRIQQVSTGKVVKEFVSDPDGIYRTAWLLSADNKTLMTVTNDVFRMQWLYFWDVATGKELYRREARTLIHGLCDLSPDGRLVGTVDILALAEIFDLETKEFVAACFVSGAQFTCLRFAPDGKTFAVGDQNGMVRIYETPKVK
jgi:WD40 repeat protein